MKTGRRDFLKSVALSGAVPAGAQVPSPAAPAARPLPSIGYPRKFTGRQLAMLAFPLGGVGAGSISLGGRGQLRDWEIFNRPDKGHAPAYGFPSIWAQAGAAKPVARVLESRILPPYEGASGLGARNAPGLQRLGAATFTGEFPLARIDFRDARLPVKVSLEAFSPFIPHDPDDSGLPVAILRYRVVNPGTVPARCAIAFSIDNPVGGRDERRNDYRKGQSVEGLFMHNPSLAASDPLAGTFALSVAGAADGKLTYLRGWPKARWWAAPMLFWDDFTEDGELGPEPEARNTVASLSLKREIAPGGEAVYTFLLSWHFPNRTPARCGWHAPKGDEQTLIGNYYCQRFKDAWEAAEYAAANLAKLEGRTRKFAAAVRESTLPGAVKEAAMANLSTLCTTTCFRTADGEFHGFEGVNDKAGCCHGNCTHVWNYETATHYLFPSFARSLRRAAFGYSMDENGAMHFRQALPDGKVRSGFAAADGQMGQIMKAYIDWRLTGDNAWLREMWPKAKRALEFAWIPGGWDADRDGVLEGVQHNTYDVEFYGPNPQCGIYYLGALRAAEEMARAAGDAAAADTCRSLFERGRQWTDANLFNGEYYIQKVRGIPKDKVAAALRSSMGADDTEHPEWQLGEGCLVDQLIGQYQAEVAGLGPLLHPANIEKALRSVFRHNYKREVGDHDNVQRTYVLNDESALVVCEYGSGKRPRIPFPYCAEAWTGLEYAAAAHMLYAGMIDEGVECIRNTRARYDGERRNPWDEAECGHHYARAMAAWSGLLALSGFDYDGPQQSVRAVPRVRAAKFASFWATGTGWGIFRQEGRTWSLEVLSGELTCRTVAYAAPLGAGTAAAAEVNGRAVKHSFRQRNRGRIFLFDGLTLQEGDKLVLRA